MLKNKNRGITLVALVITIIILLILAGISISALTNQGLFGKAKEAKEKSEQAEVNQAKTLNEYEDELNKYMPGNNVKKVKDNIGKVLSTTDNIELQDEYGNKIVVPAGFKITNDAITVDKGIVVEDATSAATARSQFVWVPVGKIYTDEKRTEDNIKTIVLGRFDFDSSTGTESEYSGSYVEEDVNKESALKKYGNKIAKNITKFQNSVSTNGGYYIGRYEAGVTGYDANNITTENSNQDTNWTGYTNATGQKLQVVSKANQQVWNYVTQNKAADLAQKMYDSPKFTSDLMNSYAWDTAITFIQKCTDKTNYARATSANKGSAPVQTGTTTDNPCNIFDMASNVMEWTTETCYNSVYPCVDRGGSYSISNNYAGYRSNDSTSSSCDYFGFRPLLYL